MKDLTIAERYIIANLGKRERLRNFEGHGKSISTKDKGFAPSALISCEKKKLIKRDYFAMWNTTYVELTELGMQVACGIAWDNGSADAVIEELDKILPGLL